MSYQRNYDDYEEDNYERIQRKKAFMRAKRRRRLIVVLILWVVTVAVFSAVIYGGYKIVSSLVESYNGKKEFVEAPYDDRNIILVENYFSSYDDGNNDFFDITITEKDNNEIDHTFDPDASKYVGVEPGSKGLVIVDPGHGGNDGGAIGNGVTEKDVNLSIALKLREELTKRGYTVVMTRSTDEFIGLTARASFANKQDDPICLVSVHQNSVDDSASVYGVEAWTYKREGCTELGDAVTLAVSNRTGAPNRGTHYRTNLVVTSKTTMPAIIVECGYVSTPAEAEKLATNEYQTLLAKGIADGVDNFSGQ